MIYYRGSRGVSTVIGAILMLALIVTFISWFQLTQVPTINQEFESNSHADARDSMLDLRDSTVDVVIEDSNIQTTTIQNVVSYPIQPVQPRDSIATVRFNEIDEPYQFNNIDNTDLDLPDETIHVKYEPVYLELSTSNFILENGIVAERFSEQSNINKGTQIHVRGDTIYIYDLETSTSSITAPNPDVTIDSMDVEEYEVSESSENLGIDFRFKSNFDADFWSDNLEDEENVQSVSENGDYIVVNLDGNVTYDVIVGEGRYEI